MFGVLPACRTIGDALGDMPPWDLAEVRSEGRDEMHGTRPGRTVGEPAPTIRTGTGSHLEWRAAGERVAWLQPDEAAALMGFSPELREVLATLPGKGARMTLAGNAVCPDIAAAILRTLLNPTSAVETPHQM